MEDEKEFIELVVCHQNRIYGFILAMLGNFKDAEDILQQTMLTLWQKRESRDKESELLPWAFGIAKNLTRNHLRKQSRRGEFTGLREQTVERIANQHVESTETLDRQREALHDCLQHLSDFQRDLIERYYRRNIRMEDLANQFKKSVDALYKSLQRTRKSLFECVTKNLSAEDLS